MPSCDSKKMKTKAKKTTKKMATGGYATDKMPKMGKGVRASDKKMTKGMNK